MVKRPFLAHEALYCLTLFAPAITVLISNGKVDSADRALACLLSTWVCTAVLGVTVHLAVNWLAPRLGLLGVGAAAATLVIVEMQLLMPRLVWLDPNFAGSPIKFVAQALVVGAVYIAVARLVTWLRERSDRSRIEALQAQVNPHFLFNTLNAIASLIPNDPERAEATVERLAGVLQYAIGSSLRGRVKLGEEIDAVRDYLAIEQARFGERLQTDIAIDASVEDQAIPPMLVQPLVENAVLHGLGSKSEGGTVTVRGRMEEDAVILEVSDDGVGPGRSMRRGNRTALQNLRERLALTYGAKASLSVRERSGGGFECAIRVPR